jgi:hypothetical protein
MIDKDKVVDLIETIDAGGDTNMQIAKLAGELKVVLLSDGPVGGAGGLSEASRKRAWGMVNEIAKLILPTVKR